MSQYAAPEPRPMVAPAIAVATPATTPTNEKRLICNQAFMLHITGFGIISGVPFLNVILPTLFWLWKMEQHQYIAAAKKLLTFKSP